jgi:hypothetical protein
MPAFGARPELVSGDVLPASGTGARVPLPLKCTRFLHFERHALCTSRNWSLVFARPSFTPNSRDHGHSIFPAPSRIWAQSVKRGR